MPGKLENSITLIREDLLPEEKHDIRNMLQSEISRLIMEDFEKLVQLLYRIDVSENKLRQTLSENPATDAATIIADLIIERQIQKLRTRKNQLDRPDIPEDEKW